MFKWLYFSVTVQWQQMLVYFITLSLGYFARVKSCPGFVRPPNISFKLACSLLSFVLELLLRMALIEKSAHQFAWTQVWFSNLQVQSFTDSECMVILPSRLAIILDHCSLFSISTSFSDYSEIFVLIIFSSVISDHLKSSWWMMWLSVSSSLFCLLY